VLLADTLTTVGTAVGIVVGLIGIVVFVLGPYRNRPRLRLHVHREAANDAGSLSFTVHVYNDGASTVNNIRMVSRVGGEVVGERAEGLVHIHASPAPADARISIPSPEYVVRRDDGTLDFPCGDAEFCACYRYYGLSRKKCEPYPLRPGEAVRSRTLTVRRDGGFDGFADRVTTYAVIDNDDDRIERGVMVDALIGGEPVASSAPVDVEAKGSQRVSLDIPRRFIVNLAGEHPAYTGEFSLRAQSRNGTTATFLV
jgi:hypothetical protein